MCARGSAGSTCLLHLCTRRHSVQDKDVFPCSYSCCSKHVALRPQKRGGLLGDGGGEGGGGKSECSTARSIPEDGGGSKPPQSK